MLYMMISTWPMTASPEIARALIEPLTMASENLSRIGLLLVPGGDGIKAYAIYETVGDEAESYRELKAGYYNAYKNIDGYKLIIEPLLTAEEALPFLGI
ncbi:MAG: hypothetical protein SWK76_17760 [Actinomycetota bacterium]|nr:hypothetical protein [Actinomycetota bacterium]